MFVFFPLLQKRSVCDAMQKRSVACTAGNTRPRQGLRMSAPVAAMSKIRFCLGLIDFCRCLRLKNVRARGCECPRQRLWFQRCGSELRQRLQPSGQWCSLLGLGAEALGTRQRVVRARRCGVVSDDTVHSPTQARTCRTPRAENTPQSV